MKLSKIVLALFVIFSLIACSKDDKGIEDGLRLTVDGKEIDFAFYAFAEYDSIGSIHNLSIHGDDAERQPNLVDLGITMEGPITPRIYNHLDSDGEFYVTLDWAPSGEDYSNPYYSGLDGPDPMSIEITSISATRVQGTFQGTVRHGASETKVISKGSFNLAIR